MADEDQFIPDQASNKEPTAETQARAEAHEDRDDTAERELIADDLKKQAVAKAGAGISNRPIDVEKREQQQLPPRHETRDRTQPDEEREK
jgi:hypothetical protein